jgi:DNA invertase Pin-like site-specific DNA recombinase
VGRFILRFFLVVTEEEREIIREEAKRRGMEDEESNIIREALRLYFDRYGTKLPPGAFAERKRGNKPKIDPQPEVNLLGV